MAKTSARTPSVTLPIEEVLEVREYLEAEQVLQDHIAKNPEWYEQLKELITARNDKLEQAEKAVRPMGVSCGPFIKLSETEKIDPEKLWEWLGKDDFQKFGGYTETVVDYKVDRHRFLAHVAKGDIPKEVVDASVRVILSYKKPEGYKLP